MVSQEVEENMSHGMPETHVDGSTQPEENPHQGSEDEKNLKKKRKVALFLSYVGHGYQGMQRNPGCKTIEDDLFEALHKSGAISDANADDSGFQKIHWARAARTDKGVSAMCQVVSLMMIPYPDDLIERINSNLPDVIHVLGYQRVVRGFDARKTCDQRRYEYIFPAWVFDPSVQSVSQGGEPSVADESLANSSKRRRVLTERDPNFVFDEACAAKMTSILQQFEGTHNFHNYTVKMDPNSPQAKRFMLKFECNGTFEIDGEPWVRMTVLGQSFILHQIRKMVGMAIAEYKGIAPEGSLKYALKARQRIVVPMAPDLGLFLDECIFKAYNDRWKDLHGPLSFDVYRDEVEKFKMAKLYPSLAHRDREENVNASWLQGIHEDAFKFSTWKSGKPTGALVGSKKRKSEQKHAEKGLNKKMQAPPSLMAHLSAEYSD
jgi:tRNA pseudouridine38-40 synthase